MYSSNTSRQALPLCKQIHAVGKLENRIKPVHSNTVHSIGSGWLLCVALFTIIIRDGYNTRQLSQCEHIVAAMMPKSTVRVLCGYMISSIKQSLIMHIHKCVCIYCKCICVCVCVSRVVGY